MRKKIDPTFTFVLPRLIGIRGLAVAALVVIFSVMQLGMAGQVSASQSGVVLVNEPFNESSLPPDWVMPAAPGGTNSATLADSSLQLTTATKFLEGGVAYAQSVPSTEGIDAVFDTYQYGGDGADGIGFFLAAANPNDPQPPAEIGQPGGSLGYSANDSSGSYVPGMSYAYLGIGIDAWGNFANPDYEGTGDTNPAWDTQTTGATGPYPKAISVRGPGNGTVGYAMLASTADTSWGSGTGISGKLDGGSSGTQATSKVPVEIVINPTGSTITTASGLSVPTGEFEVAFTPIGGSQQILTGTLPTTSNGELPSDGSIIPESWINPSTGIPYQLTYGWVGSTGGDTDVHQVNLVNMGTASGAPPQFGVTMTDTGAPTSGGTMSYNVTVKNTGTVNETMPVIVTDTLPNGETPPSSGFNGGTDWTCTVSGQTVTATNNEGVDAGGSLPVLTIPVTVTATGGTQLTNTASASSDDGFPGSGSDTVTVATMATTSTGLTASPSPQTYGSPVTLTATVSGGQNPTGTVTFYDGGNSLGQATVTGNGTYSITDPNPSVGTHSFSATYSGDSNNNGSTGTTTEVINQSATTTTLTAAPGSSVYGQSVTLTATVAEVYGSAVPTGAVDFKHGGTDLGSATLNGSGVATLSTAVLPVGTDTVTVSYSGDTDNAVSSETATKTVTMASTTTSVSTVSPSPGTYDQPVTLTATVSNGSSVELPTGMVDFVYGSTDLGSGTLSGGLATISTSLLPIGTDSITASYSGDSNDLSSSSTATETVNKATTRTILNVSPVPPDTYGQPVTLTATVAESGGSAVPTGTVDFTASSTDLGVETLNGSGVAKLTTSALPVGTYTITASYSGDADNAASSGPAIYRVNQSTTTTTLSVSPTASETGATVTMTATVTGGTSPTGTVDFKDGTTDLGSVTVSSGTAVLQTSSLSVGTHSDLTATYSGDADNSGSTSTPVTETVTQATTVSLVGSPSTASYGALITLTAAVYGADPTGMVTFYDGTMSLGSGTLSGGVATLATSAVSVGSHSLMAVYPGDTNNAASTSNVVTETVNKVTSSVGLAVSPVSTTYGQPVTVTAQVYGSSPTGTVTFYDGSNSIGTETMSAGTATLTVSDLSVGNHSITATYSGDTDNTASASSAAAVTVTPGTTLQMVWQTQPGNATSGDPLNPQPALYIEDSHGNLETSSTGSTVTVALTSPNGATMGGTTTVSVNSGVATFTDLSVGQAGTYTWTPTSSLSGVTGSASEPFTVSAGAASGNLSLVVTPSLVPADGSTAATVETTVYDVYGNNVANIPVTFTTTIGTLGSQSVVTNVYGQAFDTITSTTAGTATVTAAVYGSGFGTCNVVFTPTAATQLVWHVQPGGATSGAPLGEQPVLYLEDAHGNVETGDSSSTVTVSLTNPDGAAMDGTNAVTLHQGVATFTDLSVNEPGFYTLTPASSLPGVTAPVSDSFTVNSESSGGGGGSSGRFSSTSSSSGTATVTVTSSQGSGASGTSGITALIGSDVSATATITSQSGTTVASSVPVGTDGQFSIGSLAPGTYNVVFNVTAPDGTKLAGEEATMTVNSNGQGTVQTNLIDPFGTITNASTGQPLSGITTSLYWADTELNKSNGRTPGTLVQLPSLAQFAPSQNANPYVTLSDGKYGWMVYPNADYYLVAEKNGYVVYDSRKDSRSMQFGGTSYMKDGVIHVGDTYVNYNISLAPDRHVAYMYGYPDGTFRPDRDITRAELAAVLTRIMPVSPNTSGSAISYSDLSGGFWAAKQIAENAQQGWMTGYPNGTFRPEAPVTRAEMAAALVKLMNVPTTTQGSGFIDVSGSWAAGAIASAEKAGIVSGYPDGTFRPNQYVTRAEAVTMINRVLDWNAGQINTKFRWPDVPQSYWAYNNIMLASQPANASVTN